MAGAIITSTKKISKLPKLQPAHGFLEHPLCGSCVLYCTCGALPPLEIPRLERNSGPSAQGRLCIFRRYEKTTLGAFLYSSNPPILSGKQKDSDTAAARKRRRSSVPTVSQWWSLTRDYKDLFGATVSQRFELVKEPADVSNSRGKELKKSNF
ncbi:hypothetical protein R1flu_025742 [Riccia fluitans]|uniref:Uncharacterized protein n=1 Tax=Riccia fluitans TaxID=41844 RepID=A0ABD1XZ03_9MARC